MTYPKSPRPPWDPGSNCEDTAGSGGILADVTQLVEECRSPGWENVGRASRNDLEGLSFSLINLSINR